MDRYFRRYRPWQRGEFVLVFQDTGAGGADNCAAQFLSHRWLDVPTVMQAHITATATTPLIHAELESIFDQTGVRPVVAFERNNGGGFEMDRLARLNRLGNYRIYTMKALNAQGKLVDTGKLGFDTNTATRPKMLSDLDDGLNSHLMHLYDRATVNEAFSFIVNPKTGKAEAEQGAHDDLIMALAGVWQLYQTEKLESDEQGGNVVETIPAGYNSGGIVYVQ